MGGITGCLDGKGKGKKFSVCVVPLLFFQMLVEKSNEVKKVQTGRKGHCWCLSILLFLPGIGLGGVRVELSLLFLGFVDGGAWVQTGKPAQDKS